MNINSNTRTQGKGWAVDFLVDITFKTVQRNGFWKARKERNNNGTKMAINKDRITKMRITRSNAGFKEGRNKGRKKRGFSDMQ
jgi:hypothetical protein